jgi:hypothetical protein
MAPALLWMEHVLRLRALLGIEFHTDDVKKGRAPAPAR